MAVMVVIVTAMCTTIRMAMAVLLMCMRVMRRMSGTVIVIMVSGLARGGGLHHSS